MAPVAIVVVQDQGPRHRRVRLGLEVAVVVEKDWGWG